MQTSVMLKFRPSSVVGKGGSLNFQFIKHRKSRMIAIKGCRIYPEEWDAENESFQINTCDPPRMQYLKSLFERLQSEKQQIRETIRELENHHPHCTLDDLVKFFRDKDQYSLSSFAEKQALELESSQPRTARSYRSVAKKVSRFCGGKEVTLNEITPQFVKEFEAYMKSKGNKLNTISYYFRNLRAILNRAIEQKLIGRHNENPFMGVFTGNAKTEKRAVKVDVITAMEELDLEGEKNKRLDCVRWMFLLSYYLRGISFIDLAYLKKENIVDGHITYTRRKTGQHFEVEITPEIRSILDRYKMESSDYILPVLRHGNSRDDYENALRRQNEGLKDLSARIGLDKPLTTYTARHSWASNAYAMGVPMELISQGLGHESIRTTLIYLKSFDYSTLHEANRKVISGGKNVA